ncbi:NAD(P)-dependent oxidoreductase [Mesorhizobium xinjiangense]|uniref:NAD(P)-dependent oxidoreductase n=1 Tax=Mesorhizobium xinjiangense TaxID=2678685 RepID=UPI0012ED9F2F|nr:NAD(P)-dependent oxidoreductase [Mesorhizobium xinjiangense]
MKSFPRIAMIGFGEASRAFVAGWGEKGAGRIAAHDIKAADPLEAPAMEEAAGALALACHAEPAPALAEAQVAFCLVTADQALVAAKTAAPHLPPGLLWLDGNSCAPGTKRAAAKVVEEAGGRYVDMAIMAPVHPRLHRTPALLAGPHAGEAIAALGPLDMDLRAAGDKVGDASSIKMLRSVMVKGIEALTAECILAARRAGVEGAVLASLQSSDPGIDWQKRSAYNLERMMVHGARRAAEMREVAATLRELGLPDRMAAATALWQEELAALALDPGPDEAGERADRILAGL